jgi:hypothetical protein
MQGGPGTTLTALRRREARDCNRIVNDVQPRVDNSAAWAELMRQSTGRPRWLSSALRRSCEASQLPYGRVRAGTPRAEAWDRQDGAVSCLHVDLRLLFAGIRSDVRTALEIGVWEGGSLRMWEEYFPNAEIWGLDVNPARGEVAGGRIHFVSGDQKDPDALNKVAAGGTWTSLSMTAVTTTTSKSHHCFSCGRGFAVVASTWSRTFTRPSTEPGATARRRPRWKR